MEKELLENNNIKLKDEIDSLKLILINSKINSEKQILELKAEI